MQIGRLQTSVAEHVRRAATEKSLQDAHITEMKAKHKVAIQEARRTEKRLQKKLDTMKNKLQDAEKGRVKTKNRGRNVQDRQKRARLANCYEATIQLLYDIGEVYDGNGDYSSREEATSVGMKEVMTRAMARGEPFDVSDWLPDKMRHRLEKENIEKVNQHVSDPERVAAALDAGPVTYGKLTNVLAVLLPEGRGWRPATSRIVDARKKTTATMQDILPIWVTPGGSTTWFRWEDSFNASSHGTAIRLRQWDTHGSNSTQTHSAKMRKLLNFMTVMMRRGTLYWMSMERRMLSLQFLLMDAAMERGQTFSHAL
eukprot:TRINITY_DN1675_c0_g1_i5.p1 TRINITY_DN1675_c0_g1~~TRINITY_DN1675_c0_g1_i5.p1  ORF type:complete len:313 (-),score=55.03 TRINITY_DN1675_c0_g1_i5:1934-2872(-)